MHVYKIENLKSYLKGGVTQVLKLWHTWGTFCLMISFAGAVRYFHSLAGVMRSLSDKKIPVESTQGPGIEEW